MVKYRIPVRIVAPSVTTYRSQVSEESLPKAIPEELTDSSQQKEEAAKAVQ